MEVIKSKFQNQVFHDWSEHVNEFVVVSEVDAEVFDYSHWDRKSVV